MPIGPERTKKGREDFETNEGFIENCKKVAARLYKIFTGKDIDD